MGDMAGEGVSSEVGAVLPFAGVGVAGAGVSLVAVLHLSVVSVLLVHPN